MKRVQYLLLSGSLLLFAACEQPEADTWTDLVPDKTPFMILPESGSTLASTLDAAYMPLFNEISPASIDVTGRLIQTGGGYLPVKAILIYPSTSNDWKPVWITEADEAVVEQLSNTHQQSFAQNWYRFRGHRIEILSAEDRSYYLFSSGSTLLLSESSLAIEDMIRTLHGDLPGLYIDPGQMEAGSVIMNTPNLERWVEQIADIRYRPLLQNAFAGSGPVSLRPADSQQENTLWKLQGVMTLNNETSPLVAATTSDPDDFLLDRHISSDATAYALLRRPAETAMPDQYEPGTDLDHHLEENPDLISSLARTLGAEFAFVAFAESGFMSSSEFLFLRQVDRPGDLTGLLDTLVDDDLAQQVDSNVYFLNSPILGRLFGSELSALGGFYLALNDQVAVLSRSNSLVIGAISDYERRRVIYYDDEYQSLRSQHPSELSSFIYADTPEFNSYIQPWLFPQNYMPALGNALEVVTISTSREANNSLRLTLGSHDRQEREEPFVERWTYPLQNELSGPPALANLTGDNRDEIVFSTRDGSVVVLGADGAPIVQTTTAPDQPTGPPVLFDWYGNNQLMIMQAAGRSIYAWNETGNPLPNFPVTLDEEITTPLQVMDVTRNGMAEMVVATADRQLHILNSRGYPLSGWPQTTNSIIRTSPLIGELNGERSIFAFAENGLHAWEIGGVRRNGFPVFIDSPFTGSPVIHENRLFASGADGNLYSIGTDASFNENLRAGDEGDSLRVVSIDISNSPLTHSPLITESTTRANDEDRTETVILTQSLNGSVHLHNLQGELRFSRSMGQSASESNEPRILDLDGNNRDNLVAYAASGRLFAWSIRDDSSLQNLPTTGMTHPVITDLNRDGNLEIIALTRDGIRVWTLYR